MSRRNGVPQAYEAEVAMIGSMLIDPQCVHDVRQVVTVEDVWDRKHKIVFQHVSDLVDRGERVLITDVWQHIVDHGDDKTVGGVHGLTELMDAVPSADGATSYARLIREKAHLRRLIEAADKIIRRANDSADPVQDQQLAAEESIFALSQVVSDTKVHRLGDVAREVLDDMRRRADGEPDPRVPTGFIDLDEGLADMRPGSLVVVAGETSMGKSQLALQIAYNAAKDGHTSMFFSLEMSPTELTERLIALDSDISKRVLQRPSNFYEAEWSHVESAVVNLGKADMWLADTPGLSLAELSAIARRAVLKMGVKLIVVDYLQIMEYPTPSDEVGSIRQLTGALKKLARQLSVPIMLVSQLRRRGSHESDDRPPKLQDLHGSSTIEKDANAVMLLHRKEYYHRFDTAWKAENPNALGKTELIIAKQRSGPAGVVWLYWDDAKAAFRSLNRPDWGYGDHH